MPDTATYVYCIVERDRRPASTRVPQGVPGASAPEASEIAPGLWLVAADVPLAAYSAEHIQSQLHDLEWVSKIALAHEAVVEHFRRASGATVIPMKLFTMFSNQSRAAAEMRGRRRELERVARRIRGSAEWGVRIARDPAPAGGSGASAEPARSGTAFLTAKKRARDEAFDRSRQAVEAAEHALVTLAKLAKEVRRQPAPEGAAAPPLLDAAFLVASSRTTRFKKAAKREAELCRNAGANLILSGPWPAYNFIQAEGPST